MRHLALVTSSYPQAHPGSEAAGSFVADLAEALAVHCRVSVVAPALSASAEQNGNLAVRRFAVPRLPLSNLSPLNPRNWRAIAHTLDAGTSALDALICSEHVDHILALWSLPSGYWAWRIWRRHHIGYSTWSLGSDIWTLGKLPVIRSLLRRILRDGSACFADGYRLAEQAGMMGGRSCEFLPSTRSLPQTGPRTLATAPPYRLAYLGRWHPNKGVDILMEALGLLTDEDWARIETIRICGGGPLEDVLRNHGSRLRAGGRPVELTGYLDKAAARDLLVWADYLLIPSRIESIPVVFSDAMKCMCPVVAMPVGDLPCLIERYSAGLLSSSVTPISFAGAIRQALSRPPAEFASGLRAAAADFDIARVAQQLLQALPA